MKETIVYCDICGKQVETSGLTSEELAEYGVKITPTKTGALIRHYELQEVYLQGGTEVSRMSLDTCRECHKKLAELASNRAEERRKHK